MKAASVRWLYSFDQKLVNPPGNPMGRWLLWASVALGVSFSMVNIYAALGGRRGMWTIFGHDYLRLGTEGYLTTELEWIAAVLKLGIALLPTTLLPCAGLPLPTWRTAGTGIIAATLAAYGASQMVLATRVWVGVVHPLGGLDDLSSPWRTLLWDPVFLVWGLLMLAAVRWRVAECRGTK